MKPKREHNTDFRTILFIPPTMKLPTSRSKIILDSIGPHGIRLTTFECEWPRYMHADFMTHRKLSRNGLSSRAEPVTKAIERVYTDPVEPLVWMYDQRQMNHGAVMSTEDTFLSRIAWNDARISALECAERLLDIGLHRQYLNRLLEPFVRIKMVVSATSYANFFALRYHHAPMPEIQQLASGMVKQLQESTPRQLSPGDWHLPYILDEEFDGTSSDETLCRISAARCARASFNKLGLGGPATQLDDLSVFDRLMGSDPKHASPCESQGMCVGDPKVKSGNFDGWIQFRHTILGESATDESFDLQSRIVEYDGRDYIV